MKVLIFTESRKDKTNETDLRHKTPLFITYGKVKIKVKVFVCESSIHFTTSPRIIYEISLSLRPVFVKGFY